MLLRDPARLAAALTAAARRTDYPGPGEGGDAGRRSERQRAFGGTAGQAGTGQAGTGQAGTGQAGAGQAGAGQAGAGRGRPLYSGDPLAGIGDVLASVIRAARDGRLDASATLASLTVARNLAAELERSELALIAAARDGGATWSQIAAAMGTRNRQTAQKRHADLNRRLHGDHDHGEFVPNSTPNPP
jgi:hypothetical protein